MNTQIIKLAVVDGKTLTQTVELRGGTSSATTMVRAPKGGKFILIDQNTGHAPENITLKRAGKNLHLILEGDELDAPALILEDFYGSDGQLLGLGEDGAYHEYVAADSEADREAAMLDDGSDSAHVLGADKAEWAGATETQRSITPLLVGAGALLGALLFRDGHTDQPPKQPTIEEARGQAGHIDAPIPNGGLTNDNSPALMGKGSQPGNLIEVWADGEKIGETVVDADGSWRFAPNPPLLDGAHKVTVREQGSGDKWSVHSETFELTVDTVPPNAPVIETVTDNTDPVTGDVPRDGYTNDKHPVLTGTAEPHSTVTIYDGRQLLGTAITNPQGQWTFQPQTDLPDGAHQFTATATDAAGNVSGQAAGFAVNIDTKPPAAAAEITSMTKDSGDSHTDFVTNDGAAGRLISGQLTASLLAGEKVQISLDGGQSWHDVTVGNGDRWAYQDGNAHTTDWTIQTRVVDQAGNTGPMTAQDVTLRNQVIAPDDLKWDGKAISISFDGSALQAEMKARFIIDGKVFDRQLTQDEITSGKASLAWSSEENGNSLNISASLIDNAGNVSDFRELLQTPHEVALESFESQHAARFHTGDKFEFSGFSVEVLNVASGGGFTSGFGSANQGAGQPPTSMALELAGSGTSVRFNLDESATEISFLVGDLNGNEKLTAIFRDADGKDIYTASKDASDGRMTTLSYEIPHGMGEVASVDLVLTGSIYVWIDDIKFTRHDYVQSEDPAHPELNQKIDTIGSYYGGDGDNVFAVSNVSLLGNDGGAIHGGGGVDTLKLTGTDQTLDVSLLQGTLSSTEVIDITGTGNNTVKLSLSDVLDQGGTDLFVEDGRTQMMIKGNAGDTVELSDLLANGMDVGDWTQLDETVTTDDAQYNVYYHSALNAEVLVQVGVQTHLDNH